MQKAKNPESKPNGPPLGFHQEQDLHPDLKADLVPVRKDLANPPFNMSDWAGENLRQDVRCSSLSALIGERAGARPAIASSRRRMRCRIRSSPANNANYAWIQDSIHHLSTAGPADFAMANGSMSKQTTGEREIRTAPFEANHRN